jgi:hypothetical protein
VWLSRKKVPARNVLTFLSLDIDGVLSGSVYIGGKSAERRLVVYDKRKERLDKDRPDPGPMLRYEVRVKSQVGATLHDAYDPTNLFYHVAAPGVLPVPPGVAPWEPHAEGFTLDSPTDITAFQKMQRLVDNSADVARLVKLCGEMGPGGFDALVRTLARAHGAIGSSLGGSSPPTAPGGSLTATGGVGELLDAPGSLH